jgi:hypothetical protein
MKKLIIVLFVAIVASTNIAIGQTIFLATGGKVSFFSETKAENIDATTSSMTSVLNTATGEIAFTVPMRTFKFKKSLMEEHFNEKYVESEKYPKSAFDNNFSSKCNFSILFFYCYLRYLPGIILKYVILTTTIFLCY